MRRGSTRGLSRGDKVLVTLPSGEQFEGVINHVDRGVGEVFVRTTDDRIRRLLPSCVKKVA